MNLNPRLREVVKEQKFPMVFVTISGAHLYGFPSPDSDYDLRGVHVLPVSDVVGLDTGTETIEVSQAREGIELDLVTHDIKKFFKLLLKKNGYVLEQLFSPLVVHSTPEHAELKAIAKGCITRYHSYHYLGFAETEWKLLDSFFKLPYIPGLIARKLDASEKGTIQDADMAFHQKEYERLRSVLEQASLESKLPERATGSEALNELLIRTRLHSTTGSGFSS